MSESALRAAPRDDAQPRRSAVAALNYMRSPAPAEELVRLTAERADLIARLKKVNMERAELELHILLSQDDA